MPHRIKVINNFLSQEEINICLNIIKKSNLSVFKDSTSARISEENEEILILLRKYSDRLTEAHREEYGFYPKLYTTQGYFTMWVEGGYVGPHIDNPKHNEGFIQFSSIIYLNDDYEGGEIEFPNQKFKYKPKSGDAVIFPSGGTEHVHKVNTIKNGLRYTIAMWHSSRVDRANRTIYPELN